MAKQSFAYLNEYVFSSIIHHFYCCTYKYCEPILTWNRHVKVMQLKGFNAEFMIFQLSRVKSLALKKG